MDSDLNNNDSQRWQRFQFRLSELFICVTVFAVVFAMIKRWGINGFEERLEVALVVAVIPATVMEIHLRIKENLGW